MFRKSSLRPFALLLAIAALAAAGWWQFSRPASVVKAQGPRLRFQTLAYSDTFAVVSFDVDYARSARNPGCTPTNVTLLDARGKALASSREKGAAFTQCTPWEKQPTTVHYQTILVGDFTHRPPMKVQVAVAEAPHPNAVRDVYFSALAPRRTTLDEWRGLQNAGLKIKDALQVGQNFYLQACQELPDAGDWVPTGNLRLANGTSGWVLNVWAVPHYNAPGVLTSAQRCFLLQFIPNPEHAPVDHATPTQMQITWQRNIPECIEDAVFQKQFAPLLTKSNLSKTVFFQKTTLPDGEVQWCVSPDGLPASVRKALAPWTSGPTVTLALP